MQNLYRTFYFINKRPLPHFKCNNFSTLSTFYYKQIRFFCVNLHFEQSFILMTKPNEHHNTWNRIFV